MGIAIHLLTADGNNAYNDLQWSRKRREREVKEKAG